MNTEYTSITQYLTPEDVGHEPTDDLEAFCDRATDWLTDNEPDHLSLEVTPARPGEAGRVVLDATGTSINVALEEDEREEVYYLFEQAWMHACSTEQA